MRPPIPYRFGPGFLEVWPPGGANGTAPPAALAANTEHYRARILAYPEGQLAAEAVGWTVPTGTPEMVSSENGGRWAQPTLPRIIAAASAQRITQQFLQANGESYDRITDGGRFTRSRSPPAPKTTMTRFNSGILPPAARR